MDSHLELFLFQSLQLQLNVIEHKLATIMNQLEKIVDGMKPRRILRKLWPFYTKYVK